MLRRTGRGSCCKLVALLVTGCVSAAYLPRDGLLWHPGSPVAVPDLSRSGWERIQIDGADLAFDHSQYGVIAVRVRGDEEERPLLWESRSLWLGVAREDGAREERTVQGRVAVEMSARSEGLWLRTLVIQVEPGCLLDIAHVAADGDSRGIFDAFVAGIAFEDGA